MNNPNNKNWYEGTKSCVDANIHQLSVGVIDEQKCRELIMNHIETLVEIQVKN